MAEPGLKETQIRTDGAQRRAPASRGYLWAMGVVAGCTALAWSLFPLVAEANLIMVYLLGVLLVAVRLGRGPALLASVLSVLAFDLCFVPPVLSFAVSDTRYLVTFASMLLAATVISDLAARQREARILAQQREERTGLLYAVSQAYASATGQDAVLTATARHLGPLFDGAVTVLLPDPMNNVIAVASNMQPGLSPDVGVAQWVYERAKPAGPGTSTLPGANAVYVPLIGAHGRVGVLCVRRSAQGEPLNAEQLQLLQVCASQTALALERVRLAWAVQRAAVEAATERARSALLASVSHDLRTPLAVVMGNLSSALDPSARLDAPTREQLTRDAYGEAERLDRLVDQLLAMTRLESGPVVLKRGRESIEELIGAALSQLERQLVGRPVVAVVPPDVPLVALDAQLITRVVVNLVENALIYTPAGTPIRLRAAMLPLNAARAEGGTTEPVLLVEVADAGPGLPKGAEGRVFEKFYRGPTAQQRGVGLGLALCRSIVEAHGGAIWAESGAGGGATFRFWLPVDRPPPRLQQERAPAQAGGEAWRKAG